MRNHELTYRPVLGGIGLFNPANGVPGTLGAVVTDGVDRFLLSCYHVLGRHDGSACADDEAVWQAQAARGGSRVATLAAARVDLGLDAAAVRLDPAIPWLPEQLSLGAVRGEGAPAVGMRVRKAGATTGVTDGEVVRVDGDGRVVIAVPQGFPAAYAMNEPGDSGALWLDPATGRGVALHRGDDGLGRAVAQALPPILASLGVRLEVV